MSDASLLVEKHDSTAVITMNNPPANTWTPESLRSLKSTVEELNQDTSIAALVLASNSDKFFSAGADLARFNHSDKGKSLEFAQAFGEAFQTLTQFRGVSIAAITGYAMGGGLEAALCCDIRIAESHAVMALPEASVGLLPCGLGTQHLPWLVGEAWAKRMILLGEKVDAQKAQEIGLVQEVVDSGTVLEHALALASKAKNQSPTALRACKSLIMQARSYPVTTNFSAEQDAFLDLWNDANQLEGVQAFLEKRAPKWT